MKVNHFLLAASLMGLLGVSPAYSDDPGLITGAFVPGSTLVVREFDLCKIRNSKCRSQRTAKSSDQFRDEFDFPFDAATLNDLLLETAAREVHFAGETLTRSALDEALQAALADCTPRFCTEAWATSLATGFDESPSSD
jgi:hypothetical protein